MFTRNVGGVDKAIRLIAGAALIGWSMLVSGFANTTSVVVAVVGAVLVVTALVNFCPLFKILGISTHKS